MRKRIVPLRKDGSPDQAFASSKECELIIARLEWYLDKEGFNDFEDQITISFAKRTWLVRMILPNK